MNVVDVEQHSPEWLAARAGLVTASNIDKILAKGKGGEASRGRANYRAQMIAERLTGEPSPEGFKSEAMRDGTLLEPIARQMYEAREGVLVQEVGLVLHPFIPLCGASPDGLVGDDGGIEIKCPFAATHVDWLLEDRVPPEHVKQMQFVMAVTERQWLDFISYNDRLPEDIALFVKRLPRDDAWISSTEAEVLRFNAEVDDYIARLRPRASNFRCPHVLITPDRITAAAERGKTLVCPDCLEEMA